MLERDLEKRFTRRVRAAGCRTYKIAPTTAGIPDRLVLIPGGTIALVELKTETGKLSPIQQLWHAQAAALGTTVVVLYGVADVDAWTSALHLIG